MEVWERLEHPTIVREEDTSHCKVVVYEQYSFSSPMEIGGSRDQISLEDMGTRKALILYLAGSFRLSLDVKDIVKA
jgi:hypothetical protein